MLSTVTWSWLSKWFQQLSQPVNCHYPYWCSLSCHVPQLWRHRIASACSGTGRQLLFSRHSCGASRPSALQCASWRGMTRNTTHYGRDLCFNSKVLGSNSAAYLASPWCHCPLIGHFAEPCMHCMPAEVPILATDMICQHSCSCTVQYCWGCPLDFQEESTYKKYSCLTSGNQCTWCHTISRSWALKLAHVSNV